MDSAPSTKRRRTDDSNDDQNAILRSSEYWFDDGNIILQVESTQFRVAKSVLSMHSSVFRDMFTMPLPSDEPTVENCPVVVLPGDAAQDWIHLLGVIYPKSFLHEVPTVGLLAGVLRLSKKYDIPFFREDCLRRLKKEFPTTFEEYDDISGWTHIQFEMDMLVPLASLARELGLHSVLPAIFYLIVVTTGECAYMDRVLNDKLSLSIADRLACLQGYIKLLELQSQTTMSWLDVRKIPSLLCNQRTECRRGVKKINYELCREHRPGIFALERWQTKWGTNLCEACNKEAQKIFQDGKKECWNKLPSMFGLPKWEELRSSDFE